MRYENRVKLSYQAQSLLLACITVAMMTTRTDAQLFYDFVEQTSQDVIATLELSSLPATLSEFQGLTFTPEGEALFGLGPEYLGDFDSDSSNGSVAVDDLEGGLEGLPQNVRWIDTNPPYSLIPPLELPTKFIILEVLSGHHGTASFLILDEENNFIRAMGDWSLVPEPSNLSLIGVAVLFGTGMGRRRKRHKQ